VQHLQNKTSFERGWGVFLLKKCTNW